MTFKVLVPREIDADRVVRLTRRADGGFDVVWIDTEGQYGKSICTGPVGRAILAWRAGTGLDEDALRASQGMDG
jgi:hypothetical protein